MLTLAPLFTDNFTPDANPLNPANWASIGFANLKAVGGLCESAAASGTVAAEQYIGSVIPNNCYVSFKVGAYNMAGSAGASFLGAAVRASANGTDGWDFLITDNGNGTAQVEASATYGGGATTVDIYNGLTDPNPVVNDVYTLVVIGQMGYAFKNGVLLGDPVSIPGARTSGVPLALVVPAVDLPVTQIAISQFIVGSAAGGLSGGLSYGSRFRF